MDKSVHGVDGIGSVHTMEVRVGYSSQSNFRKNPGLSNQSASGRESKNGNNLMQNTII